MLFGLPVSEYPPLLRNPGKSDRLLSSIVLIHVINESPKELSVSLVFGYRGPGNVYAMRTTMKNSREAVAGHVPDRLL